MTELKTGTISSNELSVSADVDLSAIPYLEGSKFNIENTYSTSNTHEETKTMEKNVINKMTTNITVPENKFFLTLAEMKMIVFRVDEKTTEHIVLFTGNSYVGGFGKNQLRHQILDDSLTTVARAFNLNTLTLRQREG